MYLTAHRAQEPKSRTTAIHVFVHLHDSDELFSGSIGDRGLLQRVTEAEPGRLVDRELTFRVGGNAVLSFLDVIAPDNTPRSQLHGAMASFRDRVGPGPSPDYERYGSVLVSFGAVFGLQGLERREYDNLREALEPVIDRFYAQRGG